MSKSCVGCKYLYTRDTGYSNWTVLGTDVICAKENNPKLPDEMPYDWNRQINEDNWDCTNAGRCSSYEFSKDSVHIDCDGEVKAADQTVDAELIRLIDG